MEVINLIPTSVQCSINQSHPPQCPFVYFHPSTLLGTCELDSAKGSPFAPWPCLACPGCPGWVASAGVSCCCRLPAHISESLAGVGCTQHSTTHPAQIAHQVIQCAGKRLLYVTSDSTRECSHHSTADEPSVMTQCAQE